MRQTEFFCHFGPFYAFLPQQPKNQNFEKNKKASGESIILHMCAKNHDHDVLFLRYKAQQTIFCHFGPYFAL